MKVGDLVRNRPVPPGEYQHQLFENVHGDWYGVVINFVPHYKAHRPTKYNFVEVLLSSHGGAVGKTWLSDAEVEDDVEVINETR